MAVRQAEENDGEDDQDVEPLPVRTVEGLFSGGTSMVSMVCFKSFFRRLLKK
jgi:hypothetical protein